MAIVRSNAATGAGARRGTTLDPWTIVAFVYPLTIGIVIEFIGQLFLADVVGFVLLAYMLSVPDAMQRLRKIAPLLIFLAFWFLAQVATDVYRETASDNYLRGWAKIAFFGVQIMALWLFLPRRRAYIVAFGFGLAIVSIFGVSEEFRLAPWKTGWGQALQMFVASALCLRLPFIGKASRFAAPALALVALFLLLQNARAGFLISFFAAAICALVLALEAFPNIRRRITPTVFALFFAIGLAFTATVSTVYENAADSGVLGRDAQKKYEEQAGGELPLLLGGRSESLVAVQAIADSPILGHGSWARDRRYTELHRTLRLRYGIEFPRLEYIETGLIPSHSYFFGAWVEAGIVGGLFWLYVFTIPFIAVYHLLRLKEPLTPLIALFAVGLVWNIPFSPFGSSVRFTEAYHLVVLIWIIHAAREALPRRGKPAPTNRPVRQTLPAE